MRTEGTQKALRWLVIGAMLALCVPAAVAARDATETGKGIALSELIVEDLTGALTPDDLANALVGEGVSIANVAYTGELRAAGAFGLGENIVGFPDGILLSSGAAANVVGPNEFDDITADNGLPGDVDLSTLSGFPTTDAAVLEFDFVPAADQVSFAYVFASDEYNEYVNTSFNDVFAFFVNGTNCATVDADPVSINTINNGNPEGDLTPSHPELYLDNDLDDGGGAIDTEMDGLTVVLNCIAPVQAGEVSHLKLAIADASDYALDSAVFIEAGSLTSVPTDVALIAFGNSAPTVWLALVVLAAVVLPAIALRRFRAW